MTKEAQLALVDGKALTEKDVMSAIDGVIIRLHKTNDVQESLNVVNTLDRIGNVAGHAKAKLLYGLREWWRLNKPPEDDMGNHIESTTTTRKITVDRYVKVWEHIENNNIPKAIQSRPMRDLVPIASMLSQGYEPTKEQWKEIELADADLGEVINRIKKKKPRKSGLKLYLEKDGTLNLFKNNQRKYVGYLDVEAAQTDKDVAQAIERLIAGKVTRR